MQNVSFLINGNEVPSWTPLIKEIEELGYKVVHLPEKAKTTIVLSGQRLNPMVLHGRKVLLAYPMGRGATWEVIYVPILKEYYDRVIDVRKMSIEEIMDIIRGEIETTEPGSKD